MPISRTTRANCGLRTATSKSGRTEALSPVGEELEFVLTKADQIANFADYCNHCGNCDTFCPEYDGPYLKKPNFYGSRQAFEAGKPHRWVFRGTHWTGIDITGRINGHDPLVRAD